MTGHEGVKSCSVTGHDRLAASVRGHGGHNTVGVTLVTALAVTRERSRDEDER